MLKHFKDRLGAPGIARPDGADLAIGAPNDGVQAPPAFDLESFIIYRCVVGSRAYGLDHDESDTDRRGIYLAPAELQWSLFGAPEQFEDNATQSCYWELQKFLAMALKANPNILECLYSPMVEKLTPLGAELIAARQGFLSQMIFQTFNGYAMSQFKKIEQDLRNHGAVRWKHAMHLLRTGEVEANLATLNQEFRLPYIADLVGRKLAGPEKSVLEEADIAFHESEYQRLRGALQAAHDSSPLPESPDEETRAALNQLLVRVRTRGLSRVEGDS